MMVRLAGLVFFVAFAFAFGLAKSGADAEKLPEVSKQASHPNPAVKIAKEKGAPLSYFSTPDMRISAPWGVEPVQRAKGSKPEVFVPLPMEVPVPKENQTTKEKAALGNQLFFDARLSGDNTMSCATCHDPAKAFSDGRPQAKGRGGKILNRRTPSVLNVGLFTTYLWDGRAKSLEEQALGPIQSPDEMNQNLGELETELNAVPGYVKQFQAVFGTKVTREGIAMALAAFQRTLVTKPAPFDRYLKGEKNALSADAKEGMRLFVGEAGCVQCHRGPLLSDGKYYRLGVGTGDKGRGAVTGKKEDNFKFRTPSLRNMAPDGPYMHDGSHKTLQDVVTYYYRGVPTNPIDGLQLDVQPLVSQSFSEIPAIVAFLESLMGEAPKVAAPVLP